VKINLTITLSPHDVAVLRTQGVRGRDDIIKWIRAGIVAAVVDYECQQQDGLVAPFAEEDEDRR
jgi:hypothetical protein